MIVIAHPVRFLLFLLICLLALLAIIAIVFNILWGPSSILLDGEFNIKERTSANEIWRQLKQKGFTASTLPWRYHAWRLGADQSIQSGVYQLKHGEAIRGVIQRFTRGDTVPDELTITYPEGFTLNQIATRTASRELSTKEEFLSEANPRNYSGQFEFLNSIKRKSLEGYLFPDTYRVFPDDSPHDVIIRMLTNFEKKVTPDLINEGATQNRTLDQLIIMASIIEREVTNDDDMALISGILWKRYDDGAGLDADATIRYALDKWSQPLTIKDLQTESPYNTRKWRGLPPGPICNPGLRAIIAATRPKLSDYYYYLSAPSGQTIFSKTLEEHNANKAKYLK